MTNQPLGEENRARRVDSTGTYPIFLLPTWEHGARTLARLSQCAHTLSDISFVMAPFRGEFLSEDRHARSMKSTARCDI